MFWYITYSIKIFFVSTLYKINVHSVDDTCINRSIGKYIFTLLNCTYLEDACNVFFESITSTYIDSKIV